MPHKDYADLTQQLQITEWREIAGLIRAGFRTLSEEEEVEMRLMRRQPPQLDDWTYKLDVCLPGTSVPQVEVCYNPTTREYSCFWYEPERNSDEPGDFKVVYNKRYTGTKPTDIALHVTTGCVSGVMMHAILQEEQLNLNFREELPVIDMELD